MIVKKLFFVFLSIAVSLMVSACGKSESVSENEFHFPLKMSCAQKELPKKWEDGIIFVLEKNKMVLWTEAPKPGGPTLMMGGSWNTTLEKITFIFNTGIHNSSVIPLKNPKIMSFGKVKKLSVKLPDGDKAISFKMLDVPNPVELQCIVPQGTVWIVENLKKVEPAPVVEQVVRKAEPVVGIVEESKEEILEEQKVIEKVPAVLSNYRPSFSCDGKLTKNESLICDSQELSKLDSEMATAYKSALNQAEFDPAIIRNEQRAWRKKRDAECHDEKCLIESYNNRLNEF